MCHFHQAVKVYCPFTLPLVKFTRNQINPILEYWSHDLFVWKLECQSSADIYRHLFIPHSAASFIRHELFMVQAFFIALWIFPSQLIEDCLIDRWNRSSLFPFTLASKSDHTALWPPLCIKNFSALDCEILLFMMFLHLSMGQTNWTTCWPFLLSTIIKVVFVPSHHVWQEALLTHQQMILWSARLRKWHEYLICKTWAIETRTHCSLWASFRLCMLACVHPLLNIHEKADKINRGTQLTFIWREQPLKTCWEVGGRNGGGARVLRDD